MTCVAAVVQDGVVYIGGDSAISGSNAVDIRATPKVFRVGEAVIGTCWSARAADLVEFMDWPDRPADRNGPEDDRWFLVTRVAKAVKDAVWKSGAENQDQDTPGNTQMLIGYRGKLYVLEPDWHIHQPAKPYFAIGSGSEIATGVLYTLNAMDGDDIGIKHGMTPEQQIHTALDAAVEHTAFVRGPYTIRRSRTGDR